MGNADATAEEEGRANKVIKRLRIFSSVALKLGDDKFPSWCLELNSENDSLDSKTNKPSSGAHHRVDHDFEKPRAENIGGDFNGIEAVRTMLLVDRQEQVDKLKVNFGREWEAVTAEWSSFAPTAKPWNLRARKVARKATIDGDEAKFTIPLSRQEAEEDYLARLGHKPPRRPKKRAKAVQKEIDALFPGSTLTGITAHRYKVPGRRG
ncbi:uncharacterized protein LOC131153712 [Malania oleifera]|uniref:uncharacterized protein LOC131153712 n=1 Tax=Malania oleifera TaxID=397392 RepID=UPI0025ADB00E|nr:uncharacterized protein LOC131153712 [Malania oleifera]